MKKTELFLVLVMVALGMGLWLLNRETAEPVAAAPRQPTSTPVQEAEVPLPGFSFVSSTSAPSKKASPAKPAMVQVTNGVNPVEAPLQDPEALNALALVGFDSDADEYWLDAIFDDTLPDKERADLMEDLNEVGFADPKNLTPDDLLLIQSRLELINAVLPQADDFMSQHLLEAQKDLVNMAAAAQ